MRARKDGREVFYTLDDDHMPNCSSAAWSMCTMDKSQPAPPETYRITGMDCADCARSIERGVSRLDGVSACDLDFARRC